MDHDFWLTRWRENRIGFHQSGVNPLLESFFPNLATRPQRVLVPLCGKSADLLWLADRGHDVVGVDLSDIAGRAFASENGLTFEAFDDPPFTVLRGERIAFYVGDFFKLDPSKAGSFSLIYDRAALIALPVDLRAAYVQKLMSFVDPGGQILLIAIEYDERQMNGPPFSVPESEVRAHFAQHVVEKVYDHDCLEDEPRFKERGLTAMREVVYHIRIAVKGDPRSRLCTRNGV